MNLSSLIAQGWLSRLGLAGGEGEASVSVFRQYVGQGGVITWFVLIPLSVATIALVLRYLILLRRSAQTPAGLARALVTAARRGQGRDILAITRDDPTMLGQAAYAGAAELRAGRESARAAIDEAVEERATRLFRKIEYLNVVGNVSPMIGLLGTVLGMINAFGRIYSAGGGMPDAGKLAGAISVALVTTFWGILIAIPALTTFALFRNRIDAFAAETVKLCDSVISLLNENEAAASASAGAAASKTPVDR